MTAETHGNDQELARLRTMRMVAIAVAVIAFSVLVYSFGMQAPAWQQVLLGLAAYGGIEWQRRLGRRIKELTSAQSA